MTTNFVGNCVRCAACGETKVQNDFPKNKSTRSGFNHRCKSCHSAGVSESRRRKQRFVAEYKAERGCSDCGESDPVVLDMDHRSPEDKDRRLRQKDGPARWKWGLTLLSWVDLEAELAKCDVVCANCHRRRHASKDQSA